MEFSNKYDKETVVRVLQSKLRKQAWLLALKTGTMQQREHFQAILKDLYHAFIEEQQYYPYETIQDRNKIKDPSFV